MKKLLPVVLLMALMTMQADAQRRVNLEHYQPEAEYVQLTMPPLAAIAISRFQTTAPAKIVELSFWFVTQKTAGGSVDIYIFGEEGGAAFPYFMMPIVQPIRIYVPQDNDKLVKVQFSTPLDIPNPTPFFVGVICRGPNVFLRMDRVTQIPTGVTSDGDSMFTSV